MKNLLTLALFACISLHAELLILKKDTGAFQPLNNLTSEQAQIIIDIYLKYKWPLCTAGRTHLENI